MNKKKRATTESVNDTRYITVEILKHEPIWTATKRGKDGKPKAPYLTKPSDSSTWRIFDRALEDEAQVQGVHGIGFYMHTKANMPEYESPILKSHHLCFIDLDSAKSGANEGNISDDAKKILDAFKGKTYIEKSQSGTGYHIYCLCERNKLSEDEAHKKPSPDGTIECYATSNRLSVYTGNEADVSHPQSHICDCTNLLLETLNTYWSKPSTPVEIASPTPTQPPLLECDLSDIDLLSHARNAKNGDKFKKLYDDGLINGYSGKDYDHSSADMTLLMMLAFWTRDASQIERLFTASALGQRDKWRNRPDYRQMSITKALEYQREQYTPDGVVNLDTGEIKKQKGKGKPLLTIDDVGQYAKDNGLTLRYNLISHNVEALGLPSDDVEMKKKDLYIYFKNDLQQDFKGATKDWVKDCMRAVSYDNAYNPVLDILASAPPWDGVDYESQLYDEVMRLPKEDKLSRELMHKFLIQSLVLLGNNLDLQLETQGIIVLNGDQGIGKTSLIRLLAMQKKLCKTGLHVNFRDKDTIIRTTSTWFAEWGELESTLRKDIESLKALITEPVDRYRTPYGTEDEDVPRRTSIIGTCNSDEFLIDETGNRRFWTIPCPNKFNYAMLHPLLPNRQPNPHVFNSLGLWKQVETWIVNGESHILSEELEQALKKRNTEYKKLAKGQQEVRDILSKTADESKWLWKWTTATDWKQTWIDELRAYSAREIGTALNAEGVEQKRMRVDGKVSRAYYLPCIAKAQSSGFTSNKFGVVK